MANQEQLEILKQGVSAWNKSYSGGYILTSHIDDSAGTEAVQGENSDSIIIGGGSTISSSKPDLVGADLRERDLRTINLQDGFLREADFRGADLNEANLKGADLFGANLSGANLSKANLAGADLSTANLSGAKLNGADLRDANLRRTLATKASLLGANLKNAYLVGADLQSADLSEANLETAILIEANFEKANLKGCRVYGINAWKVNLEDAIQTHLIITPEDEPTITVDDLEVAQFIYLMLNNQKIRNIIDTITSKSVLILGRFTDERKVVLDAIREQLRFHNYLPIIFDFEKPSSRDLTETITLLARMSRFIIADLTDPKSIPQELTSIIPELPSVPVQPIIMKNQLEYAMYEHWKRYPWVLKLYHYESLDLLQGELIAQVILPAEKWIEEQKSK